MLRCCTVCCGARDSGSPREKSFLLICQWFTEAVIRMDRAVRRLEPWKIAVIVVSVIVGLALIIGLITYLLCHDQDRYYNASFLITNVDYNPQYERQTTDEFRNLSEDIEAMISEVFRGSFLSKRYIRSHVVSLSPDPVGVLASVVLVFKFPSADSEATTSRQVNRVLLRRLKATSTYLNVDQSTIRLTGWQHGKLEDGTWKELKHIGTAL